MEQAERAPLLVFYAYAREDEALRDQLDKHLKLLKRQGLIKDWHDRRIEAGKDGAAEIDTHLNSAHIILPLISPDFIASDYCYDVEMRRAMERHNAGEARVIPVILRSCDWQNAPFARLQAVPLDALPVTKWVDPDDAFLTVTEAIRMVVDQFASRPPHSAFTPRQQNPTPAAQSITAIMAGDEIIGTRGFFRWFVEEMDNSAPNFQQKAEKDDLVVNAIEDTQSIAAQFASVAEVISARNARDAARELYKGFGMILDRYNPKPSSGVYHTTDSDYYKFLGHELFVMLFAFLVHDERWSIIGDLLAQGIAVSTSDNHVPAVEPYTAVSELLGSLENRNLRLQMHRASLHADLLNTRHSKGPLGELVPMQQLVNSDFFLFLRSVIHPLPSGFAGWRPWSTINMEQSQFLLEARYRNYALNLLHPLGVDDIHALRDSVAKGRARLKALFSRSPLFDPLPWFNIDEIGTL